MNPLGLLKGCMISHFTPSALSDLGGSVKKVEYLRYVHHNKYENSRSAIICTRGVMIPFVLESELESESWAKELESEWHRIGSKVESIPGLESVPWLESILNVKRLQSINTSMKSYFWLLL